MEREERYSLYRIVCEVQGDLEAVSRLQWSGRHDEIPDQHGNNTITWQLYNHLAPHPSNETWTGYFRHAVCRTGYWLVRTGTR